LCAIRSSKGLSVELDHAARLTSGLYHTHMTEVPLKDIAIAVIGGAAAIAAVLLVFVTFLVAKADALPAETPNAVIRRYSKVAKLGILPLATHIFAVLMAYWWLFHMDCGYLVPLWKFGFPVAVVSFFLYAAYVTWML
jgi:hypothetical protein